MIVDQRARKYSPKGTISHNSNFGDKPKPLTLHVHHDLFQLIKRRKYVDSSIMALRISFELQLNATLNFVNQI